jgi:hypothetical protein
MIKKLLTGLALCSTVFGFAQNGKSIKRSISEVYANEFTTSLMSAKTSSTSLNCDTVYNFPVFAPTTTLTLYTAATSTACTTGGYVVGNNCYGAAEMANFIAGSSYSAATSPSVTGCFVFFYKSPTTGNGTKGVGTNTVGLNIYNGSMATGPTPTIAPIVIGSTSAPMSSITAVFSATSSIGVFKFNFAAPVPVTAAGYFASVVLPTNVGDTAAIFQQKNAASTAAWEKISTFWGDQKTDWGGTINFQICVFPITGCSSVTTGLKANELHSFFNLVPNPASGVVSLVSTLSNLDFEYTVTNSLGQQLISKKISGASVNEINLNDFNAGVYFVNITSGSTTITKKLVVSK